MIARNDSALGLFNGDIGVALDRGQGLRVWFAMPDGSIKSVQPSRLPEHETTWAMTVHKSQGSEFDHAALVLPTQRTPVDIDLLPESKKEMYNYQRKSKVLMADLG